MPLSKVRSEPASAFDRLELFSGFGAACLSCRASPPTNPEGAEIRSLRTQLNRRDRRLQPPGNALRWASLGRIAVGSTLLLAGLERAKNLKRIQARLAGFEEFSLRAAR
jgi:hypothetical protein